MNLPPFLWNRISAHPSCVFQDDDSRVFVAAIPKFSFSSAAERKNELSVLRNQVLESIFHQPVRLNYNPLGKPFLLDFPVGISFSHSNRFLAIHLASKHEPGIDVEANRPSLIQVAPRVFHESELKMIDAHSNPQFGRQLLWGAKESVYKSWGKRQLLFKTSMIVEELPRLSGEPFHLNFSFNEYQRRFSLNSISLDNGELLVFTTSCQILSEPK
jgi:hypothetical protein